MATARQHHFAALLGDGKVLVGGGTRAEVVRSVEVYDPTIGTFALTSPLLTGARARRRNAWATAASSSLAA